MKVSQLLGKRYKEAPTSCVTASHQLMTRGGYMKYVSSGIYSLYTPGKRIMQKIEAIIRDEMDRIDGQEVQFPVVMPASLWQTSGRYENIGSELLRFEDRNHTPMVLGMTHEEASVQLVSHTADSYADYPFMIYQIQTKFRDEPRARAGLIRVREFTMKDAYSFHTSLEDLQAYYQRCYQAYENIFKRTGVQNMVAVQSDSGMMGGQVSHEFMLLTEIGEDRIALCDCGYRANVEVAASIVKNERDDVEEALQLVKTPEMKTIEAVAHFLDQDVKHTCKAVCYETQTSHESVVVFIRGDLEVNETKLRHCLGEEILPLEITEDMPLTAGFIGPVGLDASIRTVYDASLKDGQHFVCGANQPDHHYTGLDLARDVPEAVYVDVAKIIEGGICPHCHRPTIQVKNGIEIGNIFQLGDKYSRTMGLTYLDRDGKEKNPVMGCYGIGIGRLAASICEESHDDFGPIWPITIAPWQVEVIYLKHKDPAVKKAADELEAKLSALGLEVLYDDRDMRPGALFAEADLFGLPFRVIVSGKNMANGEVEVKRRDGTLHEKYPLDEAPEIILKLVQDELARYQPLKQA